jgi:riboflavin kinase / FMN adenylyltransferase
MATGVAVARSLAEWAGVAGKNPRAGRTVLTIGNFDGVHVGHREILRRVAERARETANLAAVVTFDPHPMKVLRPAEAPGLLSTMAQRLQEMEKLGIEAALVLRFDAELARVSPEDFVRTILAETLKMSVVLVGDNFRFGHKHAGDVKLLRELGRRYDYRVEILEPVVMAEGDMETAARLLGRPYALSGEIRRGTGTGARVVFPTLNLAPEQEILPARGVYATETIVEGRGYRSATNVGVRPTFDGKTLTIESHLLDFEQEVTAGPMQVWFWKRLRGEQKFSGPEELRGQIAKDLEGTKEFFGHLDRGRRAQQTA